MPYDLPDWIESKISPEPNSGCWLWLAGVDRKDYGCVRLGRHNGRTYNYPAHRLVYEFYCGPVDEALVMHHRCHTHCCVNPDHQEPRTQQENILEGMSVSAINARKTTCINGHSLADAYLVSGTRKCRVCQKVNMASYYKRKYAQ